MLGFGLVIAVGAGGLLAYLASIDGDIAEETDFGTSYYEVHSWAYALFGVVMLVGILIMIAAFVLYRKNPDKTGGLRCPKCSFEVMPSFKNCPKCGQPLNTTCPNCNNVVDAMSSVCPKCGIKIR